MQYIMMLKVTYSLYGLHEEFEGLSFGEGDFLVLIVEEVAIFRVLQDHVDILFIDDGIP